MSEKTILLVEDDPNDEALTRRALQRCNIPAVIIVVRDGEEALEYLLGDEDPPGSGVIEAPAVILLDLKLPKIDGPEVLKRLRADDRTRRIPVVVLTSSDEQRDLIDCYEAGANSYIRKPVDYREFTEAMGQLGRYWLELNQVAALR